MVGLKNMRIEKALKEIQKEDLDKLNKLVTALGRAYDQTPGQVMKFLATYYGHLFAAHPDTISDYMPEQVNKDIIKNFGDGLFLGIPTAHRVSVTKNQPEIPAGIKLHLSTTFNGIYIAWTYNFSTAYVMTADLFNNVYQQFAHDTDWFKESADGKLVLKGEKVKEMYDNQIFDCVLNGQMVKVDLF